MILKFLQITNKKSSVHTVLTAVGLVREIKELDLFSKYIRLTTFFVTKTKSDSTTKTIIIIDESIIYYF